MLFNLKFTWEINVESGTTEPATPTNADLPAKVGQVEFKLPERPRLESVVFSAD